MDNLWKYIKYIWLVVELPTPLTNIRVQVSDDEIPRWKNDESHVPVTTSQVVISIGKSSMDCPARR